MQPVAAIISQQVLPALRFSSLHSLHYQPDHHTPDPKQEQHDYWELCFLSQGKCKFSLGAEKFLLKEKEFVLLPPRTPHFEDWEGSEPYQLLWLGQRAGSYSLFLSRNFQISDGFRLKDLGTWHLAKVEAELANSESFKAPAISAYLTLLFVEILRRLEAAPLPKKAWQEQVVETVAEYLAANLATQITLDEISQKVGLSPNYLCALFRQETGNTIFEQLANLRLERARFLLRNTKQPIYEIAAGVGYNSQFAFSRFFQKEAGISPSSYRELEGER